MLLRVRGLKLDRFWPIPAPLGETAPIAWAAGRRWALTKARQAHRDGGGSPVRPWPVSTMSSDRRQPRQRGERGARGAGGHPPVRSPTMPSDATP